MGGYVMFFARLICTMKNKVCWVAPSGKHPDIFFWAIFCIHFFGS